MAPAYEKEDAKVFRIAAKPTPFLNPIPTFPDDFLPAYPTFGPGLLGPMPPFAMAGVRVLVPADTCGAGVAEHETLGNRP